LRQLYGDAHSFTIHCADAGGTIVTVILPLRRAHPAAAEQPVLAMSADD
jgi:hypothetical protein